MRMIEVGFLIEASSAAILLRRVTAEQSGNNSSDHATAEGIMAFFSFPQSRRLWQSSAFFSSFTFVISHILGKGSKK